MFGAIEFETQVLKHENYRGSTTQKYALLTESQANGFLTLSKNTEKTMIMKLKLVADFENAKKQIRENLNRLLTQPTQQPLPTFTAYDEVVSYEEVQEALNVYCETLDQYYDLKKETDKLAAKIKVLKLQRDNYYDQLQSIQADKVLEKEVKTGTSTFPRHFIDLYEQMNYQTKNDLCFQVMVKLLGLQDGKDFIFDGSKKTKSKVNYNLIKLSEQSYQAVLQWGRPKKGVNATDNTPRNITVNRGFITQHPTKKTGANTYQPK